jgi:uncharacterized membrane protein YhaH (DUF805 family)
MAVKKVTTVQTKVETESGGMFDRENYIWMIAGLVIMALGLVLMAGGKSNDPNVFNVKEVYSPVRITIAPILILAAFVIEIFAIFRKPRRARNANAA